MEQLQNQLKRYNKLYDITSTAMTSVFGMSVFFAMYNSTFWTFLIIVPLINLMFYLSYTREILKDELKKEIKQQIEQSISIPETKLKKAAESITDLGMSINELITDTEKHNQKLKQIEKQYSNIVYAFLFITIILSIVLFGAMIYI